MTRVFPDRLVHLALCAALALGVMAPAPVLADAPPEERQQPGNAAGVVVLGIAAIALLAHLNTRDRNDDRRPDEARDRDRDQPPPRDRIDSRQIEPRIVVPRADPRAIPIHCLKRARTHDGPVRLYMRHCLHLAGVPVHHLPAACDRRVHERDGTLRRGFGPYCLDQYGYYLPQAR
jgi:hypothetical protein